MSLCFDAHFSAYQNPIIILKNFHEKNMTYISDVSDPFYANLMKNKNFKYGSDFTK